MSEERFNVVVFDPAGFWHYVQQDMEAEDAVILSRIMVDEAKRNGSIHRVMITDSGDETNFLWERGKGIVFPTEKEGLKLPK